MRKYATVARKFSSKFFGEFDLHARATRREACCWGAPILTLGFRVSVGGEHSYPECRCTPPSKL